VKPEVKTVLIYPYSALWVMIARDLFPLADIDCADPDAPVDKLCTTWYQMSFSQLWISRGRKLWTYDVRIETEPDLYILSTPEIRAMLQDAFALLDGSQAKI